MKNLTTKSFFILLLTSTHCFAEDSISYDSKPIDVEGLSKTKKEKNTEKQWYLKELDRNKLMLQDTEDTEKVVVELNDVIDDLTVKRKSFFNVNHGYRNKVDGLNKVQSCFENSETEFCNSLLAKNDKAGKNHAKGTFLTEASAVLARMKDRFRGCYLREVEADNLGLTAKLMAYIKIGSEGEVKHIHFEKNDHQRGSIVPLGRCISSYIYKQRFPIPPKDTVRIIQEISFNFHEINDQFEIVAFR